MDIPFRHDFTLSRAWNSLFPRRTPVYELENHQRSPLEPLNLCAIEAFANLERADAYFDAVNERQKSPAEGLSLCAIETFANLERAGAYHENTYDSHEYFTNTRTISIDTTVGPYFPPHSAVVCKSEHRFAHTHEQAWVEAELDEKRVLSGYWAQVLSPGRNLDMQVRSMQDIEDRSKQLKETLATEEKDLNQDLHEVSAGHHQTPDGHEQEINRLRTSLEERTAVIEGQENKFRALADDITKKDAEITNKNREIDERDIEIARQEQDLRKAAVGHDDLTATLEWKKSENKRLSQALEDKEKELRHAKSSIQGFQSALIHQASLIQQLNTPAEELKPVGQSSTQKEEEKLEEAKKDIKEVRSTARIEGGPTAEVLGLGFPSQEQQRRRVHAMWGVTNITTVPSNGREL